MIDPLTALAFSIYENKGVYCLLLGSGISRPAEIPTGWEVTLDLVRRVAALQGVKDEPDWAAWYKKEFGTDPKYSELLDQLAGTPDERRSILHSYIEPTADDLAAGRKTPTRAHQAIARLVAAGYVRVIITTNFDRLAENALREVGVEPTVISSDDALKGAVPLIHSRCYVVKVHGDYLDTRIRNTDTELGAYTAELDALLDRVVDEHGLIVCGWSSDWDSALRAAIMRAPSRRYQMFWASRGQLSALAQTVVSHRAGKVITIEGADAFFERLESLVSVQADAQQANPRSVELMVASAKKFLTRPEFRIKLDELVGDELRRIDNAVETGIVQPIGAWSNDLFVSAVARYEALTEVLARVFGVLGRYGTGEELRGAVEVITRLGFRAPAGGFNALLNIRTYPAVLLFYAYGIALVKARRYDDLFKLFSATIRTGRDRAPTIVSHLLLGGWDGMDDDPWKKFMPGLERRHTALSDHLHSKFQAWTNDYIFTNGEFTSLFEEFELLGALAYITLGHSKVDLQTEMQSQFSRGYVWAPVGRASWDTSVSRPILEKFIAEQQSELLKAGFARGEQEFLSLAAQSIALLSERMSRR